MLKRILLCLIGLLILDDPAIQAGEWRVGIARVDITPAKSLWLAGYAGRKKPAEGMAHPLWAKALVFEDKSGNRAAIITTDLIGLTREISDAVGKRVTKKTGIAREQILLNSSHTHCSPVVRGCASIVYDLTDAQQKDVNDYATLLEEKLVNLIFQACQSMMVATLTYGEDQATFARNRRGRYNPNGPVDHTVPVLRVSDESGETKAILFGYACHNTTFAHTQYCGDYAGFAQIALEKKYPGVTALFMIGCGGDVNPHPRRTLALAEQHGNSLSEAVVRAMGNTMDQIEGPVKVKFQRTDLPFTAPPSRADLLAREGEGDVYSQRLTKFLLNQLDQNGAIRTTYPFPAQVISFGNDLTLIGLGGEPVLDYSVRLHEELSDRRIWVAGYCNEVFAYVPSERVLKEGGYEGGGAMKYFGIHGPFKPGLEDRIIQLVHSMLKP